MKFAKKEKNGEGKNAVFPKISFPRLWAKDLADKICSPGKERGENARRIHSRPFAARNFARKIRPNEKISARMRAGFVPDILRQGILRERYVQTKKYRQEIAQDSFPTICGKEFCAEDTSKRKNIGENARKIRSRHFATRNLTDKIICRRF